MTMASEHSVTVHQETALEKPADLLTIIQRLVDGPLDLQKVEVLERMLAMQERVSAQQREAAFADSMARLQAKLPHIDKSGKILNRDKTVRSRYSKIEDIDIALRPLCAEEGFSNSFDEVDCVGEMRRFSLTTTHRLGHAVTKFKSMPFDKDQYRSPAQSEGSTTSYAKRQLFKMMFNIIEEGEDNDGEGSAEPITEEDIRELTTMIQDTKSNLKGFLDYMGVDNLKDILRRDLRKAFTALERKKKGV